MPGDEPGRLLKGSWWSRGGRASPSSKAPPQLQVPLAGTAPACSSPASPAAQVGTSPGMWGERSEGHRWQQGHTCPTVTDLA